MLKKSKRGQQGFTLVEIAIVLVIVGLLIGGVLKGQEMIKAGKVKKATKQMEDLNTAINTYQDKTGKLPGVITAANALTDLKNQNFIATDSLTNPYGGALTAVYAAGPPVVLTVTNNSLPDYVAYKIDSTLDDGVGTTGKMQIGAAYASNEATGVASEASVTLTFVY
jgi:prepilin-type N-terminal cleavage/methylation domain-containing protein